MTGVLEAEEGTAGGEEDTRDDQDQETVQDVVQPLRDPRIGRIKDVAAGATAVTEIGGAIVVGVLLWPHLWAALHR